MAERETATVNKLRNNTIVKRNVSKLQVVINGSDKEMVVILKKIIMDGQKCSVQLKPSRYLPSLPRARRKRNGVSNKMLL